MMTKLRVFSGSTAVSSGAATPSTSQPTTIAAPSTSCQVMARRITATPGCASLRRGAGRGMHQARRDGVKSEAHDRDRHREGAEERAGRGGVEATDRLQQREPQTRPRKEDLDNGKRGEADGERRRDRAEDRHERGTQGVARQYHARPQ